VTLTLLVVVIKMENNSKFQRKFVVFYPNFLNKNKETFYLVVFVSLIMLIANFFCKKSQRSFVQMRVPIAQ